MKDTDFEFIERIGKMMYPIPEPGQEWRLTLIDIDALRLYDLAWSYVSLEK